MCVCESDGCLLGACVCVCVCGVTTYLQDNRQWPWHRLCQFSRLPFFTTAKTFREEERERERERGRRGEREGGGGEREKEESGNKR